MSISDADDEPEEAAEREGAAEADDSETDDDELMHVCIGEMGHKCPVLFNILTK